VTCEDPYHCITCGDDGVEMRVVAVDDARGLALCEAAGGARESVEIALVDAVAPGDALLVHAGTALTKVAAA
jgi:hydrogenase maturation factor